MTWELIPPSTRVADGLTKTSVAYRRNGGSFKPCLIVILNDVLIETLGWHKGITVEIQIDRQAGLLQIRPGIGRRLGRAGMYGLRVGVPYLLGKEHKATSVIHEITDDGLIVALPDWAMPMRAGIRAAAEAAAQARSKTPYSLSSRVADPAAADRARRN